MGGDITGNYQFLTGFYGLGDMPNEFQRVMDSKLGSIPFTNFYQHLNRFQRNLFRPQEHCVKNFIDAGRR